MNKMIEKLLTNVNVINDIKRLIDHAEANVISKEQMYHLMNQLAKGESTAIGDDPKNSIILSDYYRIVYSIEEHPLGKCRHISISTKEDTIKEDELALFLQRFGFTQPKHDGKTRIYYEKFLRDNKVAEAVNVIQLYE